MNDATASKTSGRFLSKVLKFIRSPTTDWSDLDQGAAPVETVDESAIELKEMIERKRRNDFVRNRELEMLRKARKRQTAGGGHAALDLPSVRSVESGAGSGQPLSDENPRAKIDALEVKMNGAWLDRANRGQPDSAGQAYQKTLTSDMEALLSAADGARPRGDEAPEDKPTFEKTQPAAWVTHQGIDDAAAPLGADEAKVAQAVDMLDEVPAPATPELEEVAILFANGDVTGAEKSLLALVGEGGSLEGDLQTWLMLFDLYRAAGEPSKFDSTAAAFVRRFGRSAPQWEVGAEPVEEAQQAPEPDAASAVAGQAAVAHWTAPSVIGTQSVATLNASLGRQAPPWRIDWRRVKTVEPAALPLLLAAFKGWAEMPVRLKFLGVEVLQRVLTEQTPISQVEADEQWWTLRLALLRVMNEADEFDTVALNYCITYEKSPPAWDPPRCEFNLMSETGATLPPVDATAAPSTTGPSTWLRTDVSSLGASTKSDTDVVRLELAGEILDDAAPLLQSLKVSIDTHVIELNCLHLRRIDFAAAGSLLNWAVQQHSQGRRVVFQNVNRLVDVFLGVIGISDYARVRRRVD